MPQEKRVNEKLRHFADHGTHFHAFFRSADPERLFDVAYEGAAISRDERKLGVPRSAPRKVEYVVHEVKERLAADEYGLHRLVRLLLRLDAELQHLREADDGVEGRPEVVADRREEVALGLRGLPFTPRDNRVYAVHQSKRNEHEDDLNDVVARKLDVDPVLLALEEFVGLLLLRRDSPVVVDRRIALADLVHDYVGEVARLLAVPHVAREEYEE